MTAETTESTDAPSGTGCNEALNHTLTLRDGRRLGYAEFGEPAGIPVFYFHASAGSRLERPADSRLLHRLNLRFITTDRPGHGLSDLQKDRRLLDWPEDISQLADALGIQRFYVLGYSAGGPHALACSAKLSHRVLATAVVSSPAPMGRPGAFDGLPLPNRLLAVSARWAPWLTRLIRRFMARMILQDAEQASRRMMSSLPECDQLALYAPANQAIARQSLQEAFRSGSDGVAWDDVIMNRDWGFELPTIEPSIDIWQGELDVNVPSHAAAYLHAQLPDSRMTLLEGEGHFFLLKRWREVLSTLICRERAALLAEAATYQCLLDDPHASPDAILAAIENLRPIRLRVHEIDNR